MQRIQIMSEKLFNQIAAGEVVERPSSVVKELVENAIDADSKNVLIEIVEAGIHSIKVTDDGNGIYPDDLTLAFTPHATSKIVYPEDIFNISSLGFRGEALASIASVAKVYIESKTKEDQTGHYLQIEGSQITDQGHSKAKDGTSVLVESIFYNTPARLKHLKSLNTELKHILNYIQNLALAYPDIRFTLVSDGREIFKSFGNGSLQQAIASIYQPKIARQLVAVNAENTDFKLKGYISLPTLTRTNKYYIHWFINQRPVKSRVLTEVLVKSFGKQLMVGRYPIAVMDIQLDPRLVDVNVHPTKQIVRLSKEDDLSEMIQIAVQDTIKDQRTLPTVNLDDDDESKNDENLNAFHHQESLGHSSSFTNPIFQKDSFKRESYTEPAQTFDHTIDPPVSNESYQTNLESNAPSQLSFSNNTVEDNMTTYHIEPFQAESSDKTPVVFSDLRYIGQFHGTYLLAEDASGLYFIDQHAAQEVIRYEYFMSESYDVNEKQQLLIPEILEFTLSQVQDILEHHESLKRLGIELSQFSPTSFQLDAYPSWIDGDALSDQIGDVIEKVCDNPRLTIQELISASLIMRSCRGAIKANHHLEEDQAKYLIQNLAKLDDPYHCPHGRPVIIKLTPKTMEKLFKRIQDSHTSQFDAQF